MPPLTVKKNSRLWPYGAFVIQPPLFFDRHLSKRSLRLWWYVISVIPILDCECGEPQGRPKCAVTFFSSFFLAEHIKRLHA